MAIQINSPLNGSTVGCVIDLRIYCTTESFTLKMSQAQVGGGHQCKPTKNLERRCRILGVPDDPKGRRPNNRNSNYRELISLCDFFKQSCLRLGHQITITVTDSGSTTSCARRSWTNFDGPPRLTGSLPSAFARDRPFTDRHADKNIENHALLHPLARDGVGRLFDDA